MKIALCAGGSGGHVYPAIALAQELRRQAGVHIVLLHSRHATETAIVEQSGMHSFVLDIPRTPVRRGKSFIFFCFQLFGFLLQLIVQGGRVAAFFLRWRPQAVVGFGGAATVPPLLSAMVLRIPTVLHEQNAIPGLANRWLARGVSRVCVHFPATVRLLKNKNSAVCGNPLRLTLSRLPRADAAAQFGLFPDRFTILVFGGSQGAVFLNKVVPDALSDIPLSVRVHIQVIHCTGIGKEQDVRQCYAGLGVRACVLPYLFEIQHGYSACDMAICRAGAGTLSELSFFRVPAVLVPYPHAGAHQLQNARLAAENGAAIVVEETEQAAAQIAAIVLDLRQNPERRQRMAEQMQQVSRAGAAAAVAAVVKGLVETQQVKDYHVAHFRKTPR